MDVPAGNVLAKLGHLHGAMHVWDEKFRIQRKKIRKHKGN
jgi:hypothetical protein